jgi:hypothetical protein
MGIPTGQTEGNLHLVSPGANQAFFEKCERLAERCEVDARRVCATGVALGFLRAVRCCGAVAATACASSFLVVLPKRCCFPAPLLPALGLPGNVNCRCASFLKRRTFFSILPVHRTVLECQLSPTPGLREVRGNSLYEAIQGFRVQKPEHEMRHPHCMKALQLTDHFCAASSHEVLLRAAYHLSGIL